MTALRASKRTRQRRQIQIGRLRKAALCAALHQGHAVERTGRHAGQLKDNRVIAHAQAHRTKPHLHEGVIDWRAA
jgi:hypothetical protein